MTQQKRRIELRTLALTEEGLNSLKELYVDRCLPAGEKPGAGLEVEPMILAILEREFSKAPPLTAPSAAEERIAKAVAECLRRCRSSSAPLATLAKFTSELQEDPIWTDRDAANIEAGVRKGLRMLDH